MSLKNYFQILAEKFLLTISKVHAILGKCIINTRGVSARFIKRFPSFTKETDDTGTDFQTPGLGGEAGVTTILLLDGDHEILKAVSQKLTAEGYRVFSADSLRAARRLMTRAAPSAIILERRLPDGSGLELLYEVKQKLSIPVIFYTTQGEVEDICSGLRAGANDYLIKPLDLDLFAARLAALLLTYQGGREAFYLPPLRLNLLRQVAFADDADLLLTPKEFSLLYLLARNRGETLSREELSLAVWGIDEDVGNTLDKNISRLKKKLAIATEAVIIDTSYNGGYSITIL